MRVSVNAERVERLGSTLARLGPEPVLRLEESDPQYVAVRGAAEALGKGAAMVVVILVSVSTYRLAMRAEEYWMCFSNYARRVRVASVADAVAVAEGFLKSCPGARVQLEAKLRRVRRAAAAAGDLLKRLLSNPEGLVESYEALVQRLARGLGQKPNAKTIVFSVKMAYYAYREPGSTRPVPITVPIPVDVRVACSTYSSGIVEAPGYREIVKTPEPAQEAWSRVSRISGIPEIHLDALAWTAGGIVRDSPEPARDVERLLASAGAPGILAREAARQFTFKTCA